MTTSAYILSMISKSDLSANANFLWLNRVFISFKLVVSLTIPSEGSKVYSC